MKNSEFITGQVPITKEEVRAIAINKLDLKGKKHFLDIGAGTGSVCIEVAKTYEDIEVVAIECKVEALRLIEKNKEKFQLENIKIVEGYAPVSLEDKMDGIFIGGTGGNLEAIIKWCHELLNEGGRVVANFIILDTFNECLRLMRQYGFVDIDATMLSVCKLEKLGKGEYFKPHNPIFLIEATKRSEENE
nr:decarboxylating cobalt-precorrin-6B (C(15))-methyltransferase [uncultured Cellulosilyticum sp.]